MTGRPSQNTAIKLCAPQAAYLELSLPVSGCHKRGCSRYVIAIDTAFIALTLANGARPVSSR
jgi:hypothetical protein